MSRIWGICFMFALVVINFNFVQSNDKHLCDYDDSDCFRRGASKVFANLVAGVEGLFGPVDPLFIEKITGDLATLKYHLTNVTLTGMRNCEVKLLIFHREDFTYLYHLHCPQLVYSFHYEVKGKLADKELDGEGLASITTDDYLIILNGKAQKFISEKDHKPRLAVQEFQVDSELRGKLVFKNKNLIKGDKAKLEYAVAYINDNGKEIDEYLRSPILESFLTEVIRRIDLFLKTFPLNEVISKEE